MQSRILLGLLALCLGVAACGLIPYHTARNEPVCPDKQTEGPEAQNPCLFKALRGDIGNDRKVPRARGEFSASDPDVPAVFVGVAISGGGSRAANFGTAALEQLDQLGMLQNATAISTTSGGGLAGAYYALKGPSIDWKDARERMGTNFLKKWVFRNLRPDKLLTTTFTHEDRSDLMADIFDEVLFDGATYGSLKELDSGHPILLVNATDATHGTRFTFTQDVFADRQRSYLDSYPLSQAVMASAAFPGVFNSVTLKRYPGLMQPRRPGEPQDPPVPIGFDHLIDGGPTDNLGIEALVSLAASHQRSRARSLPAGAKQAPCFFFVIDAFPAGVTSRKSWEPDPRGAIDHIVDFNFLDAFDALLIQRRANLLALLGLGGSGGGTGTGGPYLGDVLQRVSFDGLPDVTIHPGRQIVEMDIPRSMNREVALNLPIRRVDACRLGECPAGVAVGTAPPPSEDYFRCTAWHINLAGLMQIRVYAGDPDQEPQGVKRDDAGLNHPVIIQRGRMQYIADQTRTNFHLVGPQDCSSKLLQDVLYAAAFVTVREDHTSRKRACKWFTDAGLAVSDQCTVFPGNRSLDVKLKLKSSGPVVAGRPGDTSVACVTE